MAQSGLSNEPPLKLVEGTFGFSGLTLPKQKYNSLLAAWLKCRRSISFQAPVIVWAFLTCKLTFWPLTQLKGVQRGAKVVSCVSECLRRRVAIPVSLSWGKSRQEGARMRRERAWLANELAAV